MKACPDCTESVQGGARVCRYCGYRFDTAGNPTPAPQNNLQRKGESLQQTGDALSKLGCSIMIVVVLGFFLVLIIASLIK
jgi:hypothetical protein